MKKKMQALSLLLALLLLFTACGASTEAAIKQEAPAAAERPAITEEAKVEMEVAADSAYEYTADINTSSSQSGSGMTVEQVETYAEKIIYSGHVYMETTTFDDAIAALDQAIQSYGGFVQDSNISGNARYNQDGTTVVRDRWAHYVVRVPAEKFDAFMALADGIGNVTSSSRSAENVTSQYTDYEARLSSLYTQEERLLKMLEESGDLESLITLEARLSEVRYEIESIERNLRNLDQKLAFSTVNLEIQEVEIYTPTATVQRTFGEKLSDAFSDGWSSFVRSMQRFIINLARSLPGLVLFVVFAGAAVLVFFKVRKRIRSKKQAAAQVQQEEQKD